MREIESTLIRFPLWDYLSEQERTLKKCGTTHRTCEYISYANCGLPYVYLRLTVLSLYMLCVKADFAVIFPAEYCRRRATIAIISPAAIASTPE